MPRINHNVSAMVTTGAMHKTERDISKTLEKLSTGLRINRAADDAAGLSISEQLRTQVKGLGMGNRNLQDGAALLNIAEGALNEVSSMLQRIRELSIQSANDTLTANERTYVQVEVDGLVSEIDRIAKSTQYNGMNLLSGTSAFGGTVGATNGGVIQAGPNATANDIIYVKIGTITAQGLAINTPNSVPAGTNCDVRTQTGATASLVSIDAALNVVNTLRADLGAKTNRIEHSLSNQENQEQNMQAAESVIRDTDFAAETTKFTRDQILSQSSTAMLAQANQIPQSVLKLLQ